MSCILCGSQEVVELHFKTPPNNYFYCNNCDLHYVDSKDRLTAEEEKKRYLTHNNDVNDKDYQNFVEPLYREMSPKILPGGWGLDFGAGTGPVLAKRFENAGYKVSLYDPFFWPNESLLHQSYDFVFACEVVEHLYHPGEEFRRLNTMLKEKGVFGAMTLFYDPTINFETWYYRRDPTHVSLYSKKTFEWIAKNLGFSRLTFSGDRVVLLEK